MLMAMMMLWRHQMRVQQRHLDCRCYSAHIKAQGSEYIWKIDQFAAYCASLPSVGPPKRKNWVLHITWAQVASCKLPTASCNCNCCRCLPVDHPLRLPLQLQLPAIVIHKCEFNLKIALILLGCRHLCIAEQTKLHPISIYNRQIRISYKFFGPHKMSGNKSKGKSLAIHFFALTFWLCPKKSWVRFIIINFI